MKQTKLICAIAGLGLIGSIMATAQEKGYWRPASSTARSITGNVAFSNEKISINFSGFPIAQIRTLTPAEASAAFDLDGAADGSGNLYRLSIPGDKRFLHRNTLCGSEDAQWMITFVEGRSLYLAFFSGSKMPVLTLDAMANAENLCGVFSYVR